MCWYKFCRRIASINIAIFKIVKIKNLLNFPCIMSNFYILFCFLRFYLESNAFLYFHFISLLLLACLLFCIRPILIIIYRRYTNRISLNNSISRLKEDIRQLVRNTEWTKFLRLFFLYLSYSIFSIITIYLYLESVINILGRDVAREYLVEPILSSYSGGAEISSISVYAYCVLLMLVCFPLFELLKANMLKVHPKWSLYKSRHTFFSFFAGVILVVAPYLMYCTYLEQNDLELLQKASISEFAELKNLLLFRGRIAFFMLFSLLFFIVIVVEDYKLTRLYKKYRRIEA